MHWVSQRSFFEGSTNTTPWTQRLRAWRTLSYLWKQSHYCLLMPVPSVSSELFFSNQQSDCDLIELRTDTFIFSVRTCRQKTELCKCEGLLYSSLFIAPFSVSFALYEHKFRHYFHEPTPNYIWS